jgi:hypothetical protein
MSVTRNGEFPSFFIRSGLESQSLNLPINQDGSILVAA